MYTYMYACIYVCVYVYVYIIISHNNPHLRMNRVTQIRATKRVTEMDLISCSWNREISRFANTSPNSPHIFKFINLFENGHDLLKGRNITGLTCTGGHIYNDKYISTNTHAHALSFTHMGYVHNMNVWCEAEFHTNTCTSTHTRIFRAAKYILGCCFCWHCRLKTPLIWNLILCQISRSGVLWQKNRAFWMYDFIP